MVFRVERVAPPLSCRRAGNRQGRPPLRRRSRAKEEMAAAAKAAQDEVRSKSKAAKKTAELAGPVKKDEQKTAEPPTVGGISRSQGKSNGATFLRITARLGKDEGCKMGVVAHGDLRRQRSNRNGLFRCPSLRAKANSAKAAFACQTRLESLIKRSSKCGNLTDRGFKWLAARTHNRKTRTPTVTIALPGSAIFKYAKSCGAFYFRAEASCRSPSRTFALVCDNCGSIRDFPFRRFFP